MVSNFEIKVTNENKGRKEEGNKERKKEKVKRTWSFPVLSRESMFRYMEWMMTDSGFDYGWNSDWGLKYGWYL